MVVFFLCHTLNKAPFEDEVFFRAWPQVLLFFFSANLSGAIMEIQINLRGVEAMLAIAGAVLIGVGALMIAKWIKDN